MASKSSSSDRSASGRDYEKEGAQVGMLTDFLFSLPGKLPDLLEKYPDDISVHGGVIREFMASFNATDHGSVTDEVSERPNLNWVRNYLREEFIRIHTYTRECFQAFTNYAPVGNYERCTVPGNSAGSGAGSGDESVAIDVSYGTPPRAYLDVNSGEFSANGCMEDGTMSYILFHKGTSGNFRKSITDRTFNLLVDVDSLFDTHKLVLAHEAMRLERYQFENCEVTNAIIAAVEQIPQAIEHTVTVRDTSLKLTRDGVLADLHKSMLK